MVKIKLKKEINFDGKFYKPSQEIEMTPERFEIMISNFKSLKIDEKNYFDVISIKKKEVTKKQTRRKK